MNIPLTGETVSYRYVEIDEVEAKCYLMKYDTYGYIDNQKMLIPPHRIGSTLEGVVLSTDGKIVLKALFH